MTHAFVTKVPKLDIKSSQPSPFTFDETLGITMTDDSLSVGSSEHHWTD